jgi:hypothetical protein
LFNPSVTLEFKFQIMNRKVRLLNFSALKPNMNIQLAEADTKMLMDMFVTEYVT